MSRETLFRAEVFLQSNVGSPADRQTLIDQIWSLQQSSLNMSFSNPGCYRINFPLKNIGWLSDKISVLLQEAVDFYNVKDPIFNKIKKTPNASLVAWANINAPGSRNTLHTHKEDDFSGVYYLQASNCGDLRFPNPANILGDCGKTSPFMRDFSFTPQDGDLIIWPSWMAHEVEPNLSNRERINLAFNIRIRA
jgi:hypothetical protein